MKKKKLGCVKVEKTLSTSSISPSTPARPTMAPQGVDEFLSSLKEYHNSETLSDVIVTCDGQEFKAHRVILSAHSKCFAKALNGEWKESSERKIEIKDFDPSIVEAMLRFIYSFEYTNTYGTSSMVFDAQMWQIADKYDIPALMAESKKKFEIAVTTGWSMDDFPMAITIVYESAFPGLRDIVVFTASKNIDEFGSYPVSLWHVFGICANVQMPVVRKEISGGILTRDVLLSALLTSSLRLEYLQSNMKIDDAYVGREGLDLA
ncbi:uncharacterized protein FFB14_05854 [Fusarium fujikuroi]|nr:uncharacterized protein FFB14_05854 [Fusarium fujikuroi]